MGAKKTHINICLGSSCYSRGNAENLDLIKAFLHENRIECPIDFKGQLCSEKCNRGPVVEINGKVYEAVRPDTVYSLLASTLLPCRP